MKPISLTTENFILLLIIVVSAFIRFFGLEGFTYSADEVSGLLRTDFSAISDVLEYGVMKRDMHPAGVQLFLYGWTALFGYGEFAVRLPFVLMGIGSVILTYRIGKLWFSEHTGLTAAALIAGLQYFVVYAEIARPYSPGLFFVLLVVFYWDKIMFLRDTKVSAYIGFTVFCVLCLYTHYYSAIVAAIIGITGFLYLDRKKLKAYLITGITIVLLFAPHIGITSYQMDTGGLHGWLGPPNKYWLFDYLFTLFNRSWILLIGIATIALISIFYKFRHLTISHKHLLCFLWFFLTFIFGFIYSRVKSPILQPSVMLFAAPFLLFLVADFIQLTKFDKKGLIVPIIILGLTVSSTVIEKNYFNTTHFGVLQELSEQNIEWENTYGPIDKAVNVSAKAYMDFFRKHKNLDVNYSLYVLDTPDTWDDLLKVAANAKSKYFSYGWSTRSNPMVSYEMIQLFYPNIVDNINYENSQITLFSKGKKQDRKSIRHIDLDLENHRYYSNLEPFKVNHPVHGTCVHIKPNMEYALEVKIPITDLSINPNEYIKMSFDILDIDGKGLTYVYQLDRDGALIVAPNGSDAWYGRKSKAYYVNDGWNKFVHARVIDNFVQDGDMAKFFFWNDMQTEAYIKNIRLEIYHK